METVTLNIDGKDVTVEKGIMILEAAKRVNIHIPTLCYLEGLQAIGACRMCIVEIKGQRALQASCVFPVAEGLVVKTNSPLVREARRMILELLLSDHRMECPTCIRNLNCELQSLAYKMGIKEVRYEGEKSKVVIDDSSPSLVRDSSKCILCRRCVAVCQEVQKVGVLFPSLRGFATTVAPAFDEKLMNYACVFCGQCSVVCPTGAIVERDDTDKVFAALDDPTKHVVIQEAPATRAQLGEEFGMPPGSLVTGKMIAALRRLGFDKVFDTNFAADLTIIEEGNELLKRAKTGGKLPMITSCSPGWIKFIEHFYPSLLPHLSTCKSPQQMFGALAKTYYAESAGIDPKDIFVVSMMPCTAKKFEASRPEMCDSGYRDIDAVVTTRELARMIRQAGIDFVNLPDEPFDAPMGEYTGAATIFGTTGGVMEAALRTVYAVVTGKNLPSLDITPVRGLDGVKEAAVTVGELGEVRIAVAHGLGNAKKLMDKLMDGTANYHFIEIMCCPGGCVGGGGQPIPSSKEKLALRAAALYHDDKDVQQFRQSHENPAIKTLYEKFLKEPLGEKSHKLLHTHYVQRGL
jgi:iron-only hydrogenase group A